MQKILDINWKKILSPQTSPGAAAGDWGKRLI